MHCTSCGAQIDDGSLSCPQCGALIASVPEASVSDGAQSDNPFARGVDFKFRTANDPRMKDVKDYIFLNILAIFLCLPFGIAGIIQGCRCNGAKKRGDFEKAAKLSGYAKSDFIIACIIGGAMFLVKILSSRL